MYAFQHAEPYLQQLNVINIWGYVKCDERFLCNDT